VSERAGSKPLLELVDVHVQFASRGRTARAVDGVDLSIDAGEVVALVGESGCGKTTLARTLVGLQAPSSGQVRVDGLPLGGRARDMRALRRRVQMVFQDPTAALDPRHTIYEAVAEGLRVHRDTRDEELRVAEALARVGMRPPERFFTLYPYEVSGGQRQRVVIAGAMVLDPEMLVADEPVSSLDASIRGEILALMRGLVDETGVAMLVVTHDLGLAWNVADRVAVMYLGRIVELGPTEQVLLDPQHPYTRALLAVAPDRVRRTFEILHGEPPDPAAVPAGCRFHPRCPFVHGGEADALGVLGRCHEEDPRLLANGSSHAAACHAVEVRGRLAEPQASEPAATD
jgi:peptide/nickel transport system ATP-binding protein